MKKSRFTSMIESGEIDRLKVWTQKFSKRQFEYAQNATPRGTGRSANLSALL